MHPPTLSPPCEARLGSIRDTVSAHSNTVRAAGGSGECTTTSTALSMCELLNECFSLQRCVVTKPGNRGNIITDIGLDMRSMRRQSATQGFLASKSRATSEKGQREEANLNVTPDHYEQLRRIGPVIGICRDLLHIGLWTSY